MARESKDIEGFDLEEFMANTPFSEGGSTKPPPVKTSKGGKAKAAAPVAEGAGAGQATAQDFRKAALARHKYARAKLLGKKKRKKRKGRRIRVK